MTDIARPQVGVATLTGTFIGTTGTALKIKLNQAQFGFQTGVSRTTGDGDSDHTYHTNDLIDGQFRLNGFVIAGAASGIENLKAQRVTTAGSTFGDPKYVMTAQLASDYAIGPRSVVFERVDIIYREGSEYIGISISGRYTDTPEGAADEWEIIG